jgi:hypothetical protein
MEHRRYLDEPYLMERVLADHAAASLRVLAMHDALPQRLRTHCARLYLRVRRVSRALARHAEAVRREREHDDEP